MHYLVYLAYVAVPITLTSFIFPVGKQTGSTVLQRPPSYMFGIVWTILYFLIARVWWLLQDKPFVNSLFGLLVTMLSLWLICYYYDKKYGLWCLSMGSTLTIGIMSWAMTHSHEAGFTLLPLVGWTLFATMLNFREIDTK